MPDEMTTSDGKADKAKSNKMLGVGVTGAVVMAACCFTPVLVVGLAAVGLSAIVGAWMDFILLPGLALFLCLIVYALVRRNKARARTTGSDGSTGSARAQS
ncbi:MAG: mercury resistance system transport protein MerF [Alphaproteobacteria bacterium]|jgi:mercuric ion transport protein